MAANFFQGTLGSFSPYLVFDRGAAGSGRPAANGQIGGYPNSGYTPPERHSGMNHGDAGSTDDSHERVPLNPSNPSTIASELGKLDVFRHSFRFYVAVAALAFGPLAYSQGCPPGQYPVVGQGWNYCAQAPGSAAPQERSQPPPRWKSQWQAFAGDSAKGILGTSKNLLSQQTAESAAISDCKQKGGSDCVLLISAANGCMALIAGDKRLKARDGDTKNDAEQKALNACKNDADTNCHVYYSECSLPVRTQ